MAEARAIVGDLPTYVSFDIDVLDPSIAPGTGTPEIGGITTREAQKMLRLLGGLTSSGRTLSRYRRPSTLRRHGIDGGDDHVRVALCHGTKHFRPEEEEELTIMSAEQLVTIPARKGKAAFVAKGQLVKIINTHGEQVVDTWAFRRDDMTEFMSNEHTRAHILKIIPKTGDALLTNHRRPILTLLEDTSGGVHDTLIAACDRYRYELLGCEGHHDNCTDNLAQGLADLGLTRRKRRVR